MPSFLKRFFAAPLFASEEKTLAARFLNTFSWSAIVLLLILILLRIILYSAQQPTSIFILGFIVLVLLVVQVAIRLGHVRTASLVLILSAWSAITYLVWVDGIRDVAAFSYLAIILLSSLLLGWRYAAVTALMSMGIVWHFAILERNGVYPPHISDPLDYARDLTTIFLLAGILIYLLTMNLNRSLREARIELKERLRAEEKLQRQSDYLTALHDTALGLVNRLELHPLLESILTRACDLVGTPHGTIHLVLPDGSAMRQELGTGLFEEFQGMLTLKYEGAIGRVWARGETVYVQDYAQWEGSLSSVVNLGVHASVCLPLKSGETVTGVLSMVHLEPEKTFNPEQISLLERFAALASIVLDNARLYEQAQIELKERRATEIALRSSEERFRTIFQASPVAICITSLEEGILLDANPAYWTISGLRPVTSISTSVLDLGLYPDKQARMDFVERLLRARSVYDPDYSFRMADGNRKPVIAFHELVDLGDETTIMSMYYDISAQKQAQAALQASEERFRKVFHTSQMAIAIVTLDDGRFVDANDAFWEMSCLRPEMARGHTTMELGMWDNPGQRSRLIEELLAKGSLKNVPYEFPCQPGEGRSALGFYELISLNDELCVLAMFYDVTSEKKAQEALRQSEARTRALLDAIPDMIFEISREGVFMNFIPSSEFQPLIPPDQFLGKNIREVFPPHVASQTRFSLERALETGQLHAFEYGLPPGEELHFFEARVTAAGKETALVMIRDITQRKWVETEREKLIKELEDKNAELERFTYTVSHDLKSPLITIKGFLGFLEKDVNSGNAARLKSDIQRISDATDKMQSLLNELLDLSRVGRLMNAPQHIPFEDLAREALSLVQGRIQTGKIHVNIQGGMASVFGDHQRLVEALQNLVDNAAKFMGDQPHPCIEIGQRQTDDGKPVFFVRDNGIGIAPTYHDRIFGLFNKLDTTSEGTGIGLALVKRIIEVHGGSIWVESEAGKGATFCLTLPASSPSPAGPQP